MLTCHLHAQVGAAVGASAVAVDAVFAAAFADVPFALDVPSALLVTLCATVSAAAAAAAAAGVAAISASSFEG